MVRAGGLVEADPRTEPQVVHGDGRRPGVRHVDALALDAQASPACNNSFTRRARRPPGTRVGAGSEGLFAEQPSPPGSCVAAPSRLCLSRPRRPDDRPNPAHTHLGRAGMNFLESDVVPYLQ